MKISAIISVITRLLRLAVHAEAPRVSGSGLVRAQEQRASTQVRNSMDPLQLRWPAPLVYLPMREKGREIDTGSIIACRHCLDAIYESQRRGENGRKYLRACRIRLSIGGAPTISRDFPERPWRMHRKNYERIRIKAKKLEEPLRINPHFRAREPDYTCHCFQ
jgi:hypothetical protein